MGDERTKEELRDELERERSKRERLETAFAELQEYVPQVDYHQPTRRDVIKGLATASLGAAGMYAMSGGASAQTLGSGEIASQANPALRVYVNRVHFVDLGSDPSSPDDGSMWYNSNA